MVQWWNDSKVMALVTKRICGESKNNLESSFLKYIIDHYEDRLPFKIGLSNGCGYADKEAYLKTNGIADKFHLYDIDPIRITEARIRHRRIPGMFIICNDALKVEWGSFDFILWAGSLHHMPDVYEALKWTKKHLNKGGVMLVFEYCGANRLGLKDTSKLKWHEAMDSERIEQALRDTFQGIEIIPIGGACFRRDIKGRKPYDVDRIIRKDNALLKKGKYDLLFACWSND